jgi:PAS domain S-box-containing protein
MTIDLNHPNPISSDQKLLALLQKISLAVAQAESTRDAFAVILADICRYMGWPLGHVYIWSQAENALVSSRIWYMDGESTIAPLRRLSEATQFKRGEGTLGLVWESGKAVSILDVNEATIFKRRIPFEEGGIRAYYAFPVLVEEKVTAVLEFFSPEKGSPDTDMTSVIYHAGALLGLAMEKEQTLSRLQHSEAQLAESQRIAHVAHWEWDLVNDEISWSEELYRIFGLAADQFEKSYEGFLKCIHPDDLAYVEKKVTDAYQNGRAFNYFHRIIRPDGTERVVYARGRPLFDQSGKIVKLYGTTQDMTEQKEVELRLAHTVRQMLALMEIAQTIAATLDLPLVYNRVLALIRPLFEAETLLFFSYEGEMLEIVDLEPKNFPDLQGLRLPIHTPIIGEVWETGRSVILRGEDCIQRLSPRIRDRAGHEPQAIMAAPVGGQKETIGVLAATTCDPNAFKEEDLHLLENAAAWMAIAIRNARQYKNLQLRLNEKEAIVAISNALTTTLDLDEVLHLIARYVQETIPNAEWTTIHLIKPDSDYLELVASAGLEIEPESYRIKMGEGIAGRVVARGEVLNVSDVQSDPRNLPIDLRTEAGSLLIAPVENRLKRIGTITVQCATPEIFTEENEQLLRILGVQAGIAVDNAWLYQEQSKARKTAEWRRERIRKMARRVVEAQEDERARIARELHDEAGQSLTSLQISLALMRGQLPEELVDINRSLGESIELIDKTMTNLRLLSHNLRPPGLDGYGLDATLAGLCHDFEFHTQLTVKYDGLEIPNLASLTALSLYRIAQEALTNIVKHAQATEVQMVLRHDADFVTLSIEDNGCGFVPPNPEDGRTGNGAGLLGMVERMEMVDGHLQIESVPGQGSRLKAIVPFMEDEK